MFFAHDALTLEEARQATLRQADPALSQGRLQFVQEDTGLLLVQRQDRLSLSLYPMRAMIATHSFQGDVTLTSELPTPAARAGEADPEALRCLMSGGAGFDSGQDALSKTDG